MDGNLPHGAVTKITLFKVGRRGCWFLSLCENFTVWCRPFDGSDWYADPKGIFFLSVAVLNNGCNCGPCVHRDNRRATEWRRSSDTIVHVSYIVALSCHQHCLTCAVERAFSNKLPVWWNVWLDSEVLRTNSGILWSNVTIVLALSVLGRVA